MKINEKQCKSMFFIAKVFPMQVPMTLMCFYDLIVLCGQGSDRFCMTFDALGTQKTSFRRGPRIDTPLSILGARRPVR